MRRCLQGATKTFTSTAAWRARQSAQRRSAASGRDASLHHAPPARHMLSLLYNQRPGHFGRLAGALTLRVYHEPGGQDASPASRPQTNLCAVAYRSRRRLSYRPPHGEHDGARNAEAPLLAGTPAFTTRRLPRHMLSLLYNQRPGRFGRLAGALILGVYHGPGRHDASPASRPQPRLCAVAYRA